MYYFNTSDLEELKIFFHLDDEDPYCETHVYPLGKYPDDGIEWGKKYSCGHTHDCCGCVCSASGWIRRIGQGYVAYAQYLRNV